MERMVSDTEFFHSFIVPSSQRRGGCAIKKTMRSNLKRADGVVL